MTRHAPSSNAVSTFLGGVVKASMGWWGIRSLWCVRGIHDACWNGVKGYNGMGPWPLVYLRIVVLVLHCPSFCHGYGGLNSPVCQISEHILYPSISWELLVVGRCRTAGHHIAAELIWYGLVGSLCGCTYFAGREINSALMPN